MSLGSTNTADVVALTSAGPQIIVAGIGCRKNTPVETVLDVLTEAFKTWGFDGVAPVMLATGEIKASEPGIIEAAERLKVPLVIVKQPALEAAAPRTLTVSETSLAYTGTPSLCEAAALSAAGETARLAAPRLVRDGVTCAIAIVNTQIRKTDT